LTRKEAFDTVEEMKGIHQLIAVVLLVVDEGLSAA